MRALRFALVAALLPLLIAPVLPRRRTRAGGGGGGSTIQWVFADDTAGYSTGTTYTNPFGTRDGGTSGTQDNHGVVIPVAGTISDFRVDLDSDIGDGTDSLVTTLMSTTTATGAESDSAVACTITGGAGTEDNCTDADTLSIGAGDKIVLKFVGAGTPTAKIWVRFKFVPTSANDYWWGFHVQTTSATVTNYTLPMGRMAETATEANTGHLIAVAGAITGLTCASSTALTSTMQRTFDFMVNGVAQSDVACVINSANQECTDTGSISIAAGDRVSIRDTPANSPTATTQVSCGVKFVPTTSGQQAVAVFSSTDQNTFVASYCELQNGDGVVCTDTESWIDRPSPATITADHIYTSVTTAPSSGKSWTFTLRESNADSSMTCAISNTATSCNSGTDVTLELSNPIDVAVTPSGGPSSPGPMRIGMRIIP